MKYLDIRLAIFLLILFSACRTSVNKEIIFKKEKQLIGKDVVEKLEVKIPGDLVVMDSVILIGNPIGKNNVLKVFKRLTGDLLCEGANKGHGPNEILSPSNIDIRKGEINMYDLNLKNWINYSFCSNGTSLIPRSFKLNTVDNVFKMLSLIDSILIANSDNSKFLIRTINLNSKKQSYFGGLPLKIKRDVPNIIDEFQGTLRISYDRKFLAYAAFKTPYWCLFKIENRSLRKIAELQYSKALYKIKNNKLVWDDENITGFMDMAIGNDRIFLIHSNISKKEKKGRSADSLPKNIYEFDFEGNPICKYHVDKPILRIACHEDNTLYAVALDDDNFKIVRY